MARGQTPNNQFNKAKRDFALSLVKEKYPDCSPTLAAEMPAEHHGFKVSRDTHRILAEFVCPFQSQSNSPFLQ